MTPRSSGPGGEYPPLRGTTNLRLTANQHCNVTENCAGVLAASLPWRAASGVQLQTAWVTFEKRPWVTSRERRRRGYMNASVVGTDAVISFTEVEAWILSQ